MLESKIIFEKALEDKEKSNRLRYNRLLEAAQVGDKPFDKEFYQTAPLPRALEQAKSIAMILSNHIGDEILSLPVATSLFEYFKLNSQEDKKITMISPFKDLFGSLTTIYPKLNLLDKVESFHFNPDDRPFCFNLNRKFHDYHIMGMGGQTSMTR